MDLIGNMDIVKVILGATAAIGLIIAGFGWTLYCIALSEKNDIIEDYEQSLSECRQTIESRNMVIYNYTANQSAYEAELKEVWRAYNSSMADYEFLQAAFNDLQGLLNSCQTKHNTLQTQYDDL